MPANNKNIPKGESFDNNINLNQGGGGLQSWLLIKDIRKNLNFYGSWKNCDDDAAAYKMKGGNIVFTTDAFIVDPIFFPGGDIGKIAMCGTLNDLTVMGAKPLGVSLSIVMEEGFPREDFLKIIKSIDKISKEIKVPVVTGDTKVIEKGKIDKIEITTAGIGLARKIIPNRGVKPGDVIISSGSLGEHTVALLSKRFAYETEIKSDSKVFYPEYSAIAKYVHASKDPTRGGLSANINEMAMKSKVKIILPEKTLPYKQETMAVADFFGLDVYSFASEGRFIAAVAKKDEGSVLSILKKYNRNACTIGYATKGSGVYIENDAGARHRLEMPEFNLVPRIC